MEKMLDDYGNSEVLIKVLPVSKEAGGSNILCGHAGYIREMAWRKERNKDLSPECRFDLPNWDDLEVYFDGRDYDA